jgi:hypothetical protein
MRSGFAGAGHGYVITVIAPAPRRLPTIRGPMAWGSGRAAALASGFPSRELLFID